MTNTLPAPDSFTVICDYCDGTHSAIAGTYHDGAPYNGRTVYGIHCPATGTNYGVLAQTNKRV